MKAFGRYTCADKSDIGMRREHNEDAYGVFPEIDLWVVADGMGGHDAGEVASGLAVEVISTVLQGGSSIQDAITSAHQEILNAPTDGVGKVGMGTTVVALQVKNNSYTIAWVGDSRAYLCNKNLVQLTRDHSYVQALVDSGVISEVEALNHPQRNVITRALGVGGRSDLKVDVITGKLSKGEQILLCSDGLSSELSDAEIEDILRRDIPLQSRINQLVGAALEAGGSDNITAVLIEAT